MGCVSEDLAQIPSLCQLCNRTRTWPRSYSTLRWDAEPHALVFLWISRLSPLLPPGKWAGNRLVKDPATIPTCIEMKMCIYVYMYRYAYHTVCAGDVPSSKSSLRAPTAENKSIHQVLVEQKGWRGDMTNIPFCLRHIEAFIPNILTGAQQQKVSDLEPHPPGPWPARAALFQHPLRRGIPSSWLRYKHPHRPAAARHRACRGPVRTRLRCGRDKREKALGL